MPAVPARTPQGDAAFFDALARDHSVGRWLDRLRGLLTNAMRGA